MTWLQKVAQHSEREPWQMTRNEFIDYHKTGFIRSDAYEQYATSEGIASFISRSRYKNFVATKNFGGVPVEIRESGDPLKYVRTDQDGEIVRDERGLATYLTNEEAVALGYRTTDGGLAAFVGDVPIGFASNEFGSAGIWVVAEWQRKGLGRYLLAEFMKRHPRVRRMGQMTNAGENLAVAYHRDLVSRAIADGKSVPPEVLADYPDLHNSLV